MGSFQQVTLGLICLAAAFAFGNYVNNNPPGEHPIASETLAESEAGSGSPIIPGNVQSRLTGSEFNLVARRPAQISTMRNPLKPRFQLPSGTTPAATASPASRSLQSPVMGVEDVAESELPPPSQLNRNSTLSKNQLDKNKTQVAQRNNHRKSRQVPDFSQIAAEFKNTPIELPKLGTMPAVRQPLIKDLQVTPIQTNRPVSVEPRGGLKDLAQQFSQGYGYPEVVDSPPIPAGYQEQGNASNERVVNMKPLAQENLKNSPFEPSPFEAQTFEAPRKAWSNPADTNTSKPGMQSIDPFANQEPEYLADNASPIVENLNQTPGWNQPLESEAFDTPNANQRTRQQDNSNRVKPRAQIGGIDYNTPPPEPSDYQNSSRQRGPQSVLYDRVARNTAPEPTSPTATNAWSKRGFEGSGQLLSNQQRQVENPNRVRTLLPFKLTDKGQVQLARLTSRTKTKIDLETTRFRNHSVEYGETLQSISTKYFGKPEYYLDIYLANRNQMRSPVDMREGLNLKIPVYE